MTATHHCECLPDQSGLRKQNIPMEISFFLVRMFHHAHELSTSHLALEELLYIYTSSSWDCGYTNYKYAIGILAPTIVDNSFRRSALWNAESAPG